MRASSMDGASRALEGSSGLVVAVKEGWWFCCCCCWRM